MTAEQWAEQLAATLPPFTAAEAAAAGRVAAELDARRMTPKTSEARVATRAAATNSRHRSQRDDIVRRTDAAA